MLRRSILVLGLLSSFPVMAQSPNPVQRPQPPDISLPQPAQLTTPIPTADDVMTLGRPPAVPISTSPIVQRPPAGEAPGASPSAVPPPTAPTAPAVLPGVAFGHAEVFDGNTLVVDGLVFVLDGADAPELGQICLDLGGAPWKCGDKSRLRLADLVRERDVRCIPAASISGGYVGTCWLGRDDVAAIMVREGMAVVPEGASSRYAGEQGAARGARRGVWSGAFDKPWLFRSRQ